MVETVRENSNIVHNDSSEHRLENKATHPKSPLDPSDQRALVNKSAGESIENEENLDREYCGQESQHQQHEHKQQHPQSDLSLELNPLNWDELRSKFDSAMQEQAEEEKKVIERFDKLVASMKIWAESSLAVEEDRAKKRLRTRIAYVQYSESKLEEKKKHYLSVVSAFQSALALLKEP